MITLFRKQSAINSSAIRTRKMLLEIVGVLLAMLFAGLLGRFIAEIATRHISNDLTKLLAGIIIGLMVGIVVGVLIKRTSHRWVKTSSGD